MFPYEFMISGDPENIGETVKNYLDGDKTWALKETEEDTYQIISKEKYEENKEKEGASDYDPPKPSRN